MPILYLRSAGRSRPQIVVFIALLPAEINILDVNSGITYILILLDKYVWDFHQVIQAAASDWVIGTDAHKA